MKLRYLLNLSLAAGLLAPAGGFFLATSAGANPLDAFTPAPATTVKESNPELDSAGQRVEAAKTKLDQARQQLKAARALLKACEAEFNAARADREALALRSEAKKLADASGLKDNGAQPVQPDASIKSFAAANPPAVTESTDLSKTRIQQADVNTQPTTTSVGDTTQPQETVSPLDPNGAPVPDLRAAKPQ